MRLALVALLLVGCAGYFGPATEVSVEVMCPANAPPAHQARADGGR